MEKLQLVGPPGLKGFIDAMGVIVKRRYPEILVREVEENGTVALHEQLIMNVTAIRSIDVSIFNFNRMKSRF